MQTNRREYRVSIYIFLPYLLRAEMLNGNKNVFDPLLSHLSRKRSWTFLNSESRGQKKPRWHQKRTCQPVIVLRCNCPLGFSHSCSRTWWTPFPSLWQNSQQPISKSKDVYCELSHRSLKVSLFDVHYSLHPRLTSRFFLHLFNEIVFSLFRYFVLLTRQKVCATNSPLRKQNPFSLCIAVNGKCKVKIEAILFFFY